jgi:hypothetical protein
MTGDGAGQRIRIRARTGKQRPRRLQRAGCPEQVLGVHISVARLRRLGCGSSEQFARWPAHQLGDIDPLTRPHRTASGAVDAGEEVIERA